MTRRQKLSLASAIGAAYPMRLVLAVLQLPRSTWYYQRKQPDYEQKWQHLRAPLEKIARRHAAYGYRRARIELRETYGQAHSGKLIQRLHKLWDLPLLRGTKRPKPSVIRQAIHSAGARANLVSSLESIELFEVLYTDFTELVFAQGRCKAWLMPLLDHRSKLVLGWAAAEEKTTTLALTAWQRARRTLARFGVGAAEPIVHHDQDPVFTSHAWAAQVLLADRCRLSYALQGPQDNDEMESFFGRFKEENGALLRDAANFTELLSVVRRRIDYYNRQRRHSSLAYVSPLAYVQRALKDS